MKAKRVSFFIKGEIKIFLVYSKTVQQEMHLHTFKPST